MLKEIQKLKIRKGIYFILESIPYLGVKGKAAYLLKKGAKLKRSRRDIMQDKADYSVFQWELCATEADNEEEEKSQRPLLARRDIKMEIEHEVRSSDSRTRVIYPTLILSEIENFRQRNRGRLQYDV